MPITCPECGQFELLGDGHRHLVCGKCAHRVAANLAPLFVVTGAAGSGKSAIIPSLRVALAPTFVVGADFLLTHTRSDFVNRWLRVAFAQAQCANHTVLCGLLEPDEIEQAPDRALVGAVEILLLDCNDKTREDRLRARKRWVHRGSERLDAAINAHLDLAARLRAACPDRIDTDDLDVEAVADRTARHIRERRATMPVLTVSLAPAG